jgi:hypothetical protein
MYKSLLVLFLVVSIKSYCQYDTIYVSDKNAVLVIFDSEFDGEIGNQDYNVTPNNNTLKISAKTKNTLHSFLQIDQLQPKKQHFFIVAYKALIKQTVYDYRETAKKPAEEVKDGKIKFGSSGNVATIATVEKTEVISNPGPNGTKEKENTVVKTLLTGDLLFDSLAEVAEKNTFEYGIYATQESRMLFKLQNVLVYEDFFIFKIKVENNSSLKYVGPIFDIFLLKKENMLRKDLPEKDRLKKRKMYPARVESIDAGDVKTFILITDAKVSDGFKTLYFMLNNDKQNRSMGFWFPTKELLKAKVLQK